MQQYRLAALTLVLCLSASAANQERRFPLAFEPNYGQAPHDVLYLGRGSGPQLSLMAGGARMQLGADTLTLRIDHGRVDAPLTGEALQPGVSNYYLTNDRSKWLVGVPNYGAVQYHQVYPGIDLTFHSRQQDLEYDFSVAPGADPHSIEIAYSGARNLETDAGGSLYLTLDSGARIRQLAPVLYQEYGGRRHPIRGWFQVRAGNRVGFSVGSYNPRHTLTIDPIFVFSTYVNVVGTATALAVDAVGNSYVAGPTPVSSGNQTAKDIVVIKLNAAGSASLYTTTFGGSMMEDQPRIVIDGNGSAYLTGVTYSTDLPIAGVPFQQAASGNGDAFVARLDGNGTLIYSSYLGGPQLDQGTGIAVGGNGLVYIVGETSSTTFPTTTGVYRAQKPGTGISGFVAKLDLNAGSILYSTFIGGTKEEHPRAIAVDSLGRVHAAGLTLSPDYPTTAGVLQTAFRDQPSATMVDGPGDGFVLKLNGAGTAAVYSTILGGMNHDEINGLAIDSNGYAYLGGLTRSPDFPTTAGALQQTAGGAFVAKLDPAGAQLTFSTRYGVDGEKVVSLALDNLGSILIAGVHAYQPITVTPDALVLTPLSSSYSGGGFAARISGTGSSVSYASFFPTAVSVIAAGPGGDIFLAGNRERAPSGTNPPVVTTTADVSGTVGVLQSVRTGEGNAYLLRIPMNGTCPVGLNLPPVSNIGAAGAGGSILVFADKACSWAIAQSNPLLAFSGNPGANAPSGTGNGSIAYQISSNIAGQPRSTVLTLSGGSQYTINQGSGCATLATASPLELPNTGSTGAVVVSASPDGTCYWHVATSASWIHIDNSGYAAPPYHQLNFFADENLSTDPRSAQIALTTFNQNLLYVHVIQAGATSVPVFADIPAGSSLSSYATLLLQNNVTLGCSTNPLAFCPGSPTTRAQMAAFLVRAVLKTENFTNSQTPYFTDVPKTSGFFNYVQKLKELGVTSGCTATTFCPNDPVTRAQMAAFLVRAVTGTTQESAVSIQGIQTFTDVPSSRTFYTYIEKLKELGITVGCSPTTFCPDDSVNRGQMAAFLVRAFIAK